MGVTSKGGEAKVKGLMEPEPPRAPSLLRAFVKSSEMTDLS